MAMQQLVALTMHSKTKFEDIKEVIRSRNSQKNRQCNGQKKKDNKTNGQTNTTQKYVNFQRINSEALFKHAFIDGNKKPG